MLRLGVLPGTFNPVTLAHMAIARSALGVVDEVVFVLPREFPHKPYTGASFEDRACLLGGALADEPRFSMAATQGGLFIDIARELRIARGTGTRLSFLCGRDAAERIVGWDYGERGAILGMLREFDLLVAARSGDYLPPQEVAEWVEPLPLDPEFQRMSSTEVRERIARGDTWEHLVPRAIHHQVRRAYTPTAAPDSLPGT